ncbi:MAG: helix-turn-helix transcriptional regulator [Candidatus Aenigmarchaeota archaeon]|nr:helix-turn-helix transcriptional regulator [Candidatus Aenigmarchaeota archaeon]
MKKSILLETIGDTIENRILDFFIEGKGLDYSKKDIADNCKISRPTVYKMLPKLEKEGLVKATRNIGRIQLYSLNEKNEKIKALIGLEGILLKKSFEDVSKIGVRV